MRQVFNGTRDQIMIFRNPVSCDVFLFHSYNVCFHRLGVITDNTFKSLDGLYLFMRDSQTELIDAIHTHYGVHP